MKPVLVFTAASCAALSHFERLMPAAGSKLDWFEYSRDKQPECNKVIGEMLDKSPSAERVENLCGTDGFCLAFEPGTTSRNDLNYISKIYGYKNDTACYDAHDPRPADNGNTRRSGAKLPWLSMPPNKQEDCNRAILNMFEEIPTLMSVERSCGTEGFCANYDEFSGPEIIRDLTLKYGYTNEKECLDAHEPKPADNAN